MTGRWALIGHGVLALALVGFAAACGADDDDDDMPIGGTGGTAGVGGTAGTTAGTSGSSSGTGGGGGSAGMMAMVTPAMCASNTKAETPMTVPACIDCVCNKPGGASIIDKVGAPGWRLIECIGLKCDGLNDGTCISTMCGAEASAMGAATEATPTSPIFGMCTTECGIGDMGGDAGI
jgi:hypothetical protein